MKDESIIAAIRDGDESAMEHVITKYSRLMWSIAAAVLKQVASEEDVEECVADVFIYLWRHPEKYDAQRGRLKVWLSILARTQAIDRYRELTKQTVLPLEEGHLVDQIGVIDGILARDTKRMLCAAVNALEEPDQEILVRRYFYEQKPREIALALDMSVKQVENRLYQTKRKLRALVTN